MEKSKHTARPSGEAQDPLWLDTFPMTPALRRQWGVVIALAVVLPGLLIGFSVRMHTDIGVVGGIALYLLEGLAALFLSIVRWLGRGSVQICPRCHRERPPGYSRCICGYPER